MAAEEEQGFTFVDKRRTAQPASEPTADAAAPQSAPGKIDTSDVPPSPPMEAEGDERFPEGAHRLSVLDRLIMCIDILNQGAWISLGLISDPATGKVEKNLPDAKIAIDAVASMAGQIENELDETTRRELRNLVRDLQLNYVQQSSQS